MDAMDDGMYQMYIPFKLKRPELSDNHSVAVRRLQSLKRRLIHNPDLHE